ncbi:MAG TPA: UDP-N-acetylglucosamine 1-carboxyvinyltransferase [Acidimicrobiia bacterium]|nr:UDP-N-acetylglucosamine 1-carboxyvinyltransferase [Acidimicrobiia bacterium]
MDRLVIHPCTKPLSGTVAVSGMTKNAGLKQMAASLLAPGKTTLSNMTKVADLSTMCELLTCIGVDVEKIDDSTFTLDCSGDLLPEAPYELVSKMRASINVLSPLLARVGQARVSLPGGDNIGVRKLDMHFKALEKMGATFDLDHGFIDARADKLVGARIVLEFPSVGATENILTAAVLADGQTTIENAAREPEVRDLCTFLTKMGANIDGVGTSTLTIEGVDELSPTSHRIVGDRIEAGTLLMACGIVGGEITLEGVSVSELEMVVLKLGDMGMKVSPTRNGIWAMATTPLRAVDISTLPFPGFATDYMPMAVALLATCEGTSIVTENIYDNRFGFTEELVRMGADIRTEGRHCVIRGVKNLSGTQVRANDVRAGASLALAGLVAKGETVVHDTVHVWRGYHDLAKSLSKLGADVTWEN